VSGAAGASTRAPAALRALLEGVVDYAGLFPPAALEMRPAVERFATYLAGDDRWALGRFVLPASRLAEFERAAAALLPTDAVAPPWRLSALVGPSVDADIALVRDFDARHAVPAAGRATVDSIEGKAATPDEIAGLARAVRTLGDDVELFVELPLAADVGSLVRAVGDAGARAKVRTGGVTADAFPSSGALARFIAACVGAGVPFKATAGLHHPLRARHRLTYAPDSPSGTMFGFLNVFAGAALLHAGMPDAELPALLEETAPDAIRFTDDGVRWRDWRADRDAITAARRGAALSFGSCSFEEPMSDLRTLGLL
jgi:hypothetical protein